MSDFGEDYTLKNHPIFYIFKKALDKLVKCAINLKMRRRRCALRD